jgi:hypothetical protein
MKLSAPEPQGGGDEAGDSICYNSLWSVAYATSIDNEDNL